VLEPSFESGSSDWRPPSMEETMRNTVTNLALFPAVVGLMLLHSAGASASPIVYNQPSVFPGPYFSWTSDRDASGGGFRSYDNFGLSQPTLIDGVNWEGFYLDEITPGNNPPVPDTTSWEISFWSNVSGQPDVLLQSQTIPVTNVQRAVVGNTTFNLPPSVPVTLFSFEADMIIPYLATPGTTYWLSVLSDSPTFNPLWSWFQGTGGDGITIQDQLQGGPRFVRAEDRTFSLEGQVVPEPSTLVLLVAGIGATPSYGGVRRLRSRDGEPVA